MGVLELLLAIVFPCGITLGIFGLVFGLSYWSTRRDGRRWAEAARRLGLELEPFDGSRHAMGLFGRKPPTIKQAMVGTRGGLAVRIWIRIVVTGSGKNRSTTYYTHVGASLMQPLGLGVQVAPVGWLGRMFQSLTGQGDLKVGLEELDRRFDIRAAEPEHAAMMLRTPFLADALVAYAGQGFPPAFDDRMVSGQEKAKVFDPAYLSRALDVMVDLSQRVSAARAQIGPTTAERAVSEGWAKVASARGLALDVPGMRMSGRAEGMHVEVETHLRAQARWTTFTVRFDRPLGVGLRLARQSGLHSFGKLLGMQDIETGDPGFDDRFLVKGAPVGRVRALLTPEVRARLVDLQDRATQLKVEDDHLRAEVAWLVADPEWVDAGSVTVARAGAALAQVVRAGVGPYRA